MSESNRSLIKAGNKKQWVVCQQLKQVSSTSVKSRTLVASRHKKMFRGRKGGSDRAKECDAVISGEYARDHTGTVVTYLAYLVVREAHVPAVAYFFHPSLIIPSHCASRLHTKRDQLPSVIGPTFLCRFSDVL